MVDDDVLHALIDGYTELGRQIAAETSTIGALHAVTTVAVRSVPGVDAASITHHRGGAFESLGSTEEAANRADAIQYELGSGPCVDAVEKDHVFCSADLASDARWPTFGPLAAGSLDLHSVLSIRLTLDEDQAAGLNLYARRRDAFDQRARDVAMVLATHAGVIVSRQLALQKAANLETALASSRDIGVAMGVLMHAYKITRDEAFDLLRITSQGANRKLRQIAIDVADTGTIDLT